jgi:hypothetical protein
MSILDPIRAGINELVLALEAKIKTSDSNGKIDITVDDIKRLISVLKEDSSELPPSLPFGI